MNDKNTFYYNENLFIFIHFITKAFVSCSLGAQAIGGALIGMGLMQLIVSCTLSMLLRHTKRYAVLGMKNILRTTIFIFIKLLYVYNVFQLQHFSFMPVYYLYYHDGNHHLMIVLYFM